MAKTAKWKRHPLAAQQGFVNSVAISADGSRVVAGTFFYNPTAQPVTKTVGTFAWDASGNQLWQDTLVSTANDGEWSGIYGVALSRDGAWAASGGAASPGLGFVCAYDAASGSKWLIHNPPARTNMVALNNDGSYLVAGADALYLFSRIGSTVNWSAPQTVTYVSGRVSSVAISADGGWIVAATYGGYVSLVRNTNGVPGPPTIFQIANGWILDVAIAADGSAFAAAGSDGVLYFFDIPGFQGSGTFAWKVALPNCSACRSVAVSDDGSLVCAAASSGKPNKPTGPGEVFLFTNGGNSGTKQWSGKTLNGPNWNSIDSTGQYATVADGTPDGKPGYFYLFDGSNGTRHWRYKCSLMCYAMQISADASAAVGGSNDGRVYYFSVP